MMLNRQRSNPSDDVLGDTTGLRAGIPGTVEAAGISAVPKTSSGSGSKDHLRFGVTSSASRPAWWMRRDADERQVFNVWARWVTASYALLVIGLLLAIWLGVGQ